MTTTVHFNIGSNIGDRVAQIERAVALLLMALRPLRSVRSDVVESDPWGFASPHSFLNMGVAVELNGQPDPHSILAMAQGVEKMISRGSHRDAAGAYADRRIDIDIISVEQEGREVSVESPALTLPHPRAREREFVMIPLRQTRAALQGRK